MTCLLYAGRLNPHDNNSHISSTWGVLVTLLTDLLHADPGQRAQAELPSAQGGEGCSRPSPHGLPALRWQRSQQQQYFLPQI